MAILNPVASSNQTTTAEIEPLSTQQSRQNVENLQAAERNLATNQSNSDQSTLEKYQNSNIVDINGEYYDEREINGEKSVGLLERSVPGIPTGAEKRPIPNPTVNFFDVNGNKQGQDLRVRILVPPKYLTGLTSALNGQGGILFPYTPSITYEASADYGTLNPMHSNFSISFYQRSKLSSITLTGKFTIQNENDAKIYIATKTLVRALTRMRSGGARSGDPDSGAPPPVCRLFAYGDLMLDNVPVAITNFRIELPDSVDYMTFKSADSANIFSVPTMSTLAITVITMYSRDEMQGFSVNSYLNGVMRGKGFI